MADCEAFSVCAFLNDRLANMPATAATFKRSYCQGNYSTCARYLVFKTLGRSKVPSDLSPNQNHKASEIILAG